MRGAGGASGRDRARDEEPPDEGDIEVESLDPAEDGAACGGRLRAWLAARAFAGPGRRLSSHARALRAGVMVTLVVATLLALLDGPALVGAGWVRLSAALRGAPAIPPLAMTGWQTVGLALNGSLTYTPDPLNPAIIYACEANGPAVTVWQTDSDGREWQSLLEIAASPPANSCRVKVALDAPAVALVVIYARDPNAPGCERLTLYSGSGGGASGAKVTLPGYQNACLGDVWPSAGALYYWWTNAQGGQAQTGLARSDDLGKTWYQLPIFPFSPHFSLAPALLDSGSADTIMTQVYLWPGPGQRGARDEVWRSLDGGFSWRRALNAPLGAQLLTTTEPGALMDVRWPPAYATVFSGGQLSPPWVPNHAPATIDALQPDGSTWLNVPRLPLPVSITQIGPAPLGISAALAVGPGDDLLALGEKPGATATLNPQRQQWLWAWDPAIQTWRAGMAAPDAAALAGITWAHGPAGGPYAKVSGAYLWLTGGDHGQQALYWTFIPTAQG